MDRYAHLFPSDVDALVRRLEDIRDASLAPQPRPRDLSQHNGLAAYSSAQCQHIRSVAIERVESVGRNVGPGALAEIHQILALIMDIPQRGVNTAALLPQVHHYPGPNSDATDD
jgi:hypothetical protein